MTNREIKFRAWDRDEKRMYYSEIWDDSYEQVFQELGDSVTFPFMFFTGEADNKGYSLVPDFTGKNSENFSYIMANPAYIKMQYTGLMDKNGKEIYEGDMVKDSEKNALWEIQMGLETKMFRKTGDKTSEFWPLSAYFSQGKPSNEFVTLEIIGNIYESPELDPRFKELKDEQVMETAREVQEELKVIETKQD